MQTRNLEMWVEKDNKKEHEQPEGDEGTFRVLFAVAFSALGEIRVGIESTPKRMNVNIWAENSHSIESELPKLQDELLALGHEAMVSVNRLVVEPEEGVPSIKSLLKGPSLHVLG
jgi:hypothetical protein